MNSTIPKRHAGTLRNRNVPFQSKNRNDDRNSIDNYALKGLNLTRSLDSLAMGFSLYQASIMNLFLLSPF